MRLNGSVILLGSVAAMAAVEAIVTTHASLGKYDDFHQSSNKRLQWPWSGESNQLDIQIPSSFLSFEPDVTISSLKCLQAALSVKSKFKTDCFQSSKSLYFSSPGKICSPECLNTTIELSKYFVDKCDLASRYTPGNPAGYNHKNIVYLSWSNHELAELVCNGPAVTDGKDDNPAKLKQNSGCYSAIFSAESARESNLLSNGGSAKEYACNSCTKEWTEKISSSNYHLSPILYYGHIPDSTRLASWISEQCGYNMAPI